ncbi:helix-turn-helix domain-containing protein [Kiloniella laminariae]|uniref:Helix-turn-helix domain-containing protein n=1 Tax=Kiloniella laminariae TaxID=454162 RepID=A0ABT4LJ09_9PROT|nr:helix-turn-helix domain-containing protein [Kiloniella laminariae]MCZ4281094.1 helix-turn-helix domain-containing protein [Kiloniella laminariae]
MRSSCPISRSLDILGDRWTLLVIRDLMFFGKNQYGEFLASPEGISTNILADRLKNLEQVGIISKEAYQHNPVRYTYSLTSKGKDLQPALAALFSWGLEHVENSIPPDQSLLKLQD